jgi:N-methylhydantoinase A/oxoprolinase/acetone carboxylase beta subunit
LQRGDLTANDSQGLVLGIDTGGTYTDVVLMDYKSRRVLASHKSLTTKRDLSIGIEAVIDGVQIKDPEAIRMVSISTTLATNAIAEGKGKPVALFLIGYDPELIDRFKLASRFATSSYFYFAGGHDLFGREKESLDLAGIMAKVETIRDQVDAIAISSYFSPLNPAHEIQAYETITDRFDLPIVLGHQLSTKLGSVERATTAALNASLLANINDFVTSVRRALARRHISAPLMVVRGDGTLMQDQSAAQTPVETIHSGPAASAIGGRYLSGINDALVIDIGGTTTDLALVQDGQVAVSVEGATVGIYKTAVEAAHLLSIGLGGDSHITIDRRQEISVGPERVVPLAHLADEYPSVRQRLKALSRRQELRDSIDSLEYWFLLREPKHERRLRNRRQKELVELLRNGPLPLPEILERLGLLHPLQIGVGSLFSREIIGKSSLTPTDLLHVEGRWGLWDVEAAAYGLRAFCRFVNQEPAVVQKTVRSRMTETITQAVIAFISGKPLKPPIQLDDDIGWYFFQNSLYQIHPQLETSFRLRIPIIGIGAPADIFLQEVADVFHTDLILPKHHEVANAVGAVAGSVMVAEEILVYPRLTKEGLEVTGYYVQTGEEIEEFLVLSEALGRARALGQERAFNAAIQAGADTPEVVIEEKVDGLDTCRVRAKAIGNPRLSRR